MLSKLFSASDSSFRPTRAQNGDLVLTRCDGASEGDAFRRAGDDQWLSRDTLFVHS